MNAIAYPRLLRRVQAVLIDSVLVPVALFGAVILGSTLGVSHPFAKVLFLLGPVIILEPGLVAFTGGTVGHHCLGIRVTKMDGASNINLLAATLRFLIKMFLGWASFIFVLTTMKHQALHDLAARSQVIHKNPSGLSIREALPERSGDRSDYVYPPAWRRVAVIAAYAVALTVALLVLLGFIYSAACGEGLSCSGRREFLAIVYSVIWMVGIGWIIVRGWGGHLYGCRKRQKTAAE